MNFLEDITTRKQLIELLQQHKGSSSEIEPANLKYAIYVRKSTDEDTKQVRSLDDQLAECKIVAQRNNIVILEENIIRESSSAKASNIRPLFRKLLDRIIAGELDGIIAWHPDRLTRNMLEAGEIIDLLDNSIIKDLKFASHPFTNDAAGKMLLGILFVMAKQYSEKLSVDITRGNERSIEEGKMVGISKHGYKKDKNGWLRPDDNNHAIIFEAFRKKINGESLESIANYVKNAGYLRRGKDNVQRQIKIHPATMGKIFADPVYTGVLKYGSKTVDLVSLHGFIPMLTVEEYLKINKLKSFEQAFKTIKSKRSAALRKADLLFDKVICAACGQVTQAGITPGKSKQRYYYFRCETKDCERYNKGTRAKVIINFAETFLASKPFASKAAYSSYKKEIVKIQNEGVRELNAQIGSMQVRVGLLEETISKIRSNLVLETDEEVKKEQKAELKRLNKELLETRTLFEELRSKKTKVSEAPLAFEKFTEIMESLPERVAKVQSTTELNAILSKVFLNFTVDTKNVIKYALNPPFDGLMGKDFPNGGDGGS